MGLIPTKTEENGAIRALFAQGAPMDEIATAVGRCSAAIEARLRRLGLIEEQRRREEAHTRAVTADENARIRGMFDQGDSAAKIGRAMGKSGYTVRMGQRGFPHLTRPPPISEITTWCCPKAHF